MSVKGLLGMMIVGLVAGAFVLFAPRPHKPADAAEPPATPVEKPWLSNEVADEIIGPGGTLGPIFEGVLLGSAPPSAETRARIAAFADANDVSIDFEIADDELVAIRFEVTFGGCCGYEGTDMLGRRIGRPRYLGDCSGNEKYDYDNWATAHDDGTHVRGAVRVNRLSLRWERTISVEDVFDRAEQLLGADRHAIKASAHERWLELDPGKRYVLEAPHQFMRPQHPRSLPGERGFTLTTDRSAITEVAFRIFDDPRAEPTLKQRLKARFGKPRVAGEFEWRWSRADRIVVATFGDWDDEATITLTRR